MTERAGLVLVCFALSFSLGCATTPQRPGTTITDRHVTIIDRLQFTDASTQFAAAEREGWSPARCRSVAAAFERIGQRSAIGDAWFDAGLALSRCPETAAEADERFLRATAADPRHAPARVQLGVAALRRGRIDEAQRWLRDAAAANPQNVEASLNLALLRLRRRAAGDLEAAQLDLRRALAVEARNVVAFDELAQVYLAQADERPETVRLAAIVCRQAALIDPRYAPLHNTCGLVRLRQGDVIAAVASFEKALALDPRFFEAAMNLGSVAGSYRGYETARDAFTRALRTSPRSYDARIGLGVALRGLEHFDEAAREYAEAMRLDASRPEAYFNLAVLHQDFRSGSVADLRRALRCLDEFVARVPETRVSGQLQAAESRRRNIRDALGALGGSAQPAAACAAD